MALDVFTVRVVPVGMVVAPMAWAAIQLSPVANNSKSVFELWLETGETPAVDFLRRSSSNSILGLLESAAHGGQELFVVERLNEESNRAGIESGIFGERIYAAGDNNHTCLWGNF